MVLLNLCQWRRADQTPCGSRSAVHHSLTCGSFSVAIWNLKIYKQMYHTGIFQSDGISCILNGWILFLNNIIILIILNNITVADFIFLGSKITANGDCSHEIKRRLLLGRKVRTNPDSILKSRDITLPTKVHLVKAMVFPVVMYGCESWTIKKAEGRRIDAFELWCWRRLLRVPWTARRSNQSNLKEISPGCSLEGLMLKLKF